MNPTEHPYAQKLQASLQNHYEYYECLVKRVSLIKNNFSTKTDYEKNEIEIKIKETNREITALKKVIEMREIYFKKFMEQFVVDVKDVEENYDSVIEKAHIKKLKNKELSDIMLAVRWEVLDDNIEAKIKLFQRIKKLVA